MVTVDLGNQAENTGSTRLSKVARYSPSGSAPGACSTNSSIIFSINAVYRLIYRITDVDIPRDTGDFRLLDRKVVNVMREMRERHRFLRGMSVWVGFKQTGVKYKRAARFTGETKYPFRKMLKFATDAVTSFSYFPLQVAMYLGFFAAGLSILAIPLVII